MSANPQPPVNAWQPGPRTQAGPAEGVVYAGFWVRLLAWILDAIAIGILTTALAPLGGGPMVASNGTTFTVNYGANAIGGLVGLVYFVGLWSWRGQSLGMMPLNLWVVRAEDGGRLDVVQAFLRYVGLIISFAVILLGVIWVAFDSRKQGWHDKIAKTFVVRR